MVSSDRPSDIAAEVRSLPSSRVVVQLNDNSSLDNLTLDMKQRFETGRKLAASDESSHGVFKTVVTIACFCDSDS